MTSDIERTDNNPEVAKADLNELSADHAIQSEVSVARNATLTVMWEHLLWVAIVGLGAALRLTQLGATPLSPEESQSALAAWNVFCGRAADMPDGPLFAYSTALVFFLFGANDATVRLLPALSGIALSALPWLLRREIGPWAALVCGFLLATSPTLVLHSRRVDSAMMVACLAMTVVVLILQLVRTRGNKAGVAAALGVGALLTGGPSGFTAVAGVLAVGAAHFVKLRPAKMPRQERELATSSGAAEGTWAGFHTPDTAAAPCSLGVLSNSEESALGATNSLAKPRPFPSDSKRMAERWSSGGWSYRYPALTALAGVLITTGLLSNLHGIQDGLLDAALVWAGGWAALNDIGWFGALPGMLVIYEPLLTLFAMVGIATMLKDRLASGGLAWWIVITLILASPIGAGSTDAMVLPLLGLAAFASLPAAELIQRLKVSMARHDFAIFAMVTLPLVWLVVFALGYVSRPDPMVPISAVSGEPTDPLLAVAVYIYRSGWIGALLPLVLLLLVSAVFAHRLGWRRTAGAAGLVGLVLLALMAVHTASLVASSEVGGPELTATSSDVRTLVRDVGDSQDALKALRREGRVRVGESLRAPLAWYLRDLDVAFSDVADSRDELVISSSDSTPPGWRRGTQRYVLLQVRQPMTGSFAERWLWYFYRESIGGLWPITVDLHVRV